MDIQDQEIMILKVCKCHYHKNEWNTIIRMTAEVVHNLSIYNWVLLVSETQTVQGGQRYRSANMFMKHTPII